MTAPTSASTYFERTLPFFESELKPARALMREGTPADLLATIEDMGPRGSKFHALIYAAVEDGLGRTTGLRPLFDDPKVSVIYSVVASFYESLRDAGASVFSDLSRQGIEEQVRTEFYQCYHQVLHNKHGRQVYEISPGLAQRLRHHLLKGLSTDDLRLPYEEIYLQVPLQAALEVWNPLQGNQPVHGISVVHDAEESCWWLLVIGREKDGSSGNDPIFHFRVPLPPGTSLDAALEIERARVLAVPEERRFIGYDYWMRSWLEIFRWVMNVVFYITHASLDDLEHVYANPEARRLFDRIEVAKRQGKHEKAKRLRVEAKHLDPMRRIVVGRNFKVWGPSETGEGPTQTRRTLVPGHWQRYWLGRKGSEERHVEWKFKSAFWRGSGPEPEKQIHVLK